MATQPESTCPDCHGHGMDENEGTFITCETCGGIGTKPLPYTPEQRKADFIRDYEERTFDPFSKYR